MIEDPSAKLRAAFPFTKKTKRPASNGNKINKAVNINF
jgi:hypothetical protein